MFTLSASRLQNQQEEQLLAFSIKAPELTATRSPLNVCIAIDLSQSSSKVLPTLTNVIIASINSISQSLNQHDKLILALPTNNNNNNNTLPKHLILTAPETIQQDTLNEFLQNLPSELPAQNSTLSCIQNAIDLLQESSESSLPAIILISDAPSSQSNQQTIQEQSQNLLDSIRNYSSVQKPSTKTTAFTENLTIHAISVINSINSDLLLDLTVEFQGYLSHASCAKEVSTSLTRIFAHISNSTPISNLTLTAETNNQKVTFSEIQPISLLNKTKLTQNRTKIQLNLGPILAGQTREIGIRVSQFESITIVLEFTEIEGGISQTRKQQQTINFDSTTLSSNSTQKFNRILFMDYLLSNMRKCENGIPCYAVSGITHLLKKLSESGKASLYENESDETATIDFLREVQLVLASKEIFLKFKPLLFSILRNHSLQSSVQSHKSLRVYETALVIEAINRIEESFTLPDETDSKLPILSAKHINKPTTEYFDIYNHSIY